VKSVELEHADDIAPRKARVQEFRDAASRTVEELRSSRLGLMLQYGPWSYDLESNRPDINQHVQDFDVDAFVQEVVDLGVEHVVWSLSWYTFQLASPLKSVVEISGKSELVSQRDLVGEIASALTARGILFFLYYHAGHDAHLSYGTTPWWNTQNWPDDFSESGLGDRSKFFDNTSRVLEEVGERYGDKLSGWFLDDGLIYYPAPFEKLGRSLRAGNPSRIVSFNSWIMPSLTEFEDVAFGEDLHGFDDVAADANGRYIDGVAPGKLVHAMAALNPDWGIHEPHQREPISEWVPRELARSISESRRRRLPLTLNALMWHPGILDPAAIAAITDAERI
jgi:hypothetical protein